MTKMPLGSRKNIYGILLATLTIAFIFSCRKSDHVDPVATPAISYKQKNISIAEDVPMTPVKPDSTGGPITGFSVSPLLPKGLIMNKINGEISGTPSDTLQPTKYVVTATGAGGVGRDTITLSIGTVAFSYGSTGTFVFEKGSTELSTTPISPVILAGTLSQYFVSPSPDSLTLKTGLKFNARTGQISGVPTQLTSTTEVSTPVTFTITGISSSNKAASTTISIVVNDKIPAFNFTYRGSFSVGTPVGNALAPVVSNTSGAIKKYRLAPMSPALPEGLVLDSLTGRISGTPTADGSTTLVIRGLNTGGYQDVNLPLEIDANPVAPQVYYMMSLFSGNVTDTIAPRLTSGGTVYLTKNDNIGGLNIYLNPVATAGQVGAFSAAPAFVSGASNENLSVNNTTGVVSGTPGQFTTNSSPSHTINIANASASGPAGAFTMNIVANAPFFTYNTGGKGSVLNNIFLFTQNQKVDVANGSFQGYSSSELSPVDGSGVVSYAIYPANTNSPAFSSTGLSFSTTTGAIGGTPTTTTASFNNYTFWDYIVQGKKADGSFTLYKIRIKIYGSIAEWGN